VTKQYADEMKAAVKEINMITGDPITRRDALCELASIPMIAMGRTQTLKASRYEEMLKLCTAAHEAANVYCLKGDPVRAMEQFRRLLSTETFALLPNVDLTEEDRLHVVNHLTDALLQMPEKDMGQIVKAWTTAMQGARERHDEVIYDEAMTNFAVMRALWRNEDAIKQLMPLTSHW
jgi:hypothetical protein